MSTPTGPTPVPVLPAAPLTLESLQHFTGSERLLFDPLFPSVKYTDGIRHLRQNGLNWLIVDLLIMLPPLLHAEDFVCVTLRARKKLGRLSFDDGNGRKIRRAVKYDYTDCPIPELKLFCRDGVLMLPSEY